MNIDRRKFLGTTAATGLVLAAGLALPKQGKSSEVKPMVSAGIITDMHHTTKDDTETRKYSAAHSKMQHFISAMEEKKPAFVIELGDFVDTLSPETDPAENLSQIESIFASYPGHYHVLGNHEFDNLTRDFFLNAIHNTGIEKGQTYFSWDSNGVHFVVLDAGYTPASPYRPYDMNTPEDTFWTWKDTCVPPHELEWLKKDLAATSSPVVIFSHQTLDRIDDQDHNIKNASVVREIFEESGKVLAVFSGHDHAGGYSNIKGIHYIVMHGNVGVSDFRPWMATSKKEGFDTTIDNQFALLEIFKEADSQYRIRLNGFGRQASYELLSTLG